MLIAVDVALVVWDDGKISSRRRAEIPEVLPYIRDMVGLH